MVELAKARSADDPLRLELAAHNAELREKLRASNCALRALEKRLLELERGSIIDHVDLPETATPPVPVLDLDALCLPPDVEARLGLGPGSAVVSDPPLPVANGGLAMPSCKGVSAGGSGAAHWQAPAAVPSRTAAAGGAGQPHPTASHNADASIMGSPSDTSAGHVAHLRVVTVESVRRGAEAADCTVTLSLVEDVGEGGSLAMLGCWGRRVLYASPGYVRMVDAPSEEVAIRGMNSAVSANTAIRASLVGFLKLLMLGGDTAPALVRNAAYHPDRRADMVFMWLIPVLVVEEADVARCLDEGRTLLAHCGSRPPRLGFVTYTDKASSLAREAESGLREHMCLKYTPTPVTMVDSEGLVVMQNAASITNIGIQGSEGRTAGSCRLNYLQELFVSDPALSDDMRAVTSTGRTWSRRLRVSDSPLLRAWMQLGPGEERWHEVAISRFRDPAYRAPTTAYIVAETDVTATVLVKRQVSTLQRQQQALLREILPQQVIDVLLRPAAASSDDEAGTVQSGPPRRVLRSPIDHPSGSSTAHGCGLGGTPFEQGPAEAFERLSHTKLGLSGHVSSGSAPAPECSMIGPVWAVMQGSPQPYAASVESSTLSSTAVSTAFPSSSLSGGGGGGPNRILTAATASGGEEKGGGSGQHLGGFLRDFTSGEAPSWRAPAPTRSNQPQFGRFSADCVNRNRQRSGGTLASSSQPRGISRPTAASSSPVVQPPQQGPPECVARVEAATAAAEVGREAAGAEEVVVVVLGGEEEACRLGGADSVPAAGPGGSSAPGCCRVSGSGAVAGRLSLGPPGDAPGRAGQQLESSCGSGSQAIARTSTHGNYKDEGCSGGAADEDADPEGLRMRGTSSAGYSEWGDRRLSRRDVMALATWHESVTVVFADIVGFTSMCQQLHPARVMAFLDDLYNAFDHLLDETGCYKVETIGDCYMVCSGLFRRPPPGAAHKAADNRAGQPSGTEEGSAPQPEQAPAAPQLGGFDPEHASQALQFAKRLVQVASSFRSPLGTPVQMRVGLHSGSVVSGVVGRRMPRFCLFGDTVNTASRMESTGAPGRIHASEATRTLLPGERWEPRGTGIDIKGRGRMQTYWLVDGVAQG